MKCPKCGAESIGELCTECGCELEPSANVNIIKDTTEDSHSHSCKSESKDATKSICSDKIPFYLSGWFIFLLVYIGSWFTLGISYVAGIVLACIRKNKYKEKKVNNNLILGGIIAPIAIIIIFFVVSIIVSSIEEKQIENYITTGQYQEAENYIKDKYGKGSNLYIENMLKVYEAQDDYDSAAILILDEIADDEPLNIYSDYIDKLKVYVNHTSEDVTTKINSKFEEIEKAKEAEAKAKSEEEAKAKAEAEAKKAEAEAEAKKAEADIAKAEADIAKAEADKAAAEASAKQAETDKVKAEADKAASEAAAKQTNAATSNKNEIKQSSSNTDSKSKEQNSETLGEYQKKLKDLGYDEVPVDSLTDAEADSIYTQTMNELNTYGKTISEIKKEMKGFKDYFGLSEKEIDALSDYRAIWYYGDIFYGEETSDDIGSEGDYYNYPVVSAKDMLRYPEKYKGQKVRMTVRINYPFDSTDVNNAYFYARQVLKIDWSLNVPLEYGESVVLFDTRKSGTRLLENDVVEIFGTCRGLKTFTSTTIGGVKSEEGKIQVDIEYAELLIE